MWFPLYLLLCRMATNTFLASQLPSLESFQLVTGRYNISTTSFDKLFLTVHPQLQEVSHPLFLCVLSTDCELPEYKDLIDPQLNLAKTT